MDSTSNMCFKQDCLFCKIAQKEKTSSISYEDEEFLIFSDHKPVSQIHNLLIPKHHLFSTAKELTINDKEFLLKMIQIAEKNSEGLQNVRIGFHWPPCNSIHHLHLHIISPDTEMSWFNRWVFRKDSWWFVSPQRLLEILESQAPPAAVPMSSS